MAESSTSTFTIMSLPSEIMGKIFDMLSVPDKCQCTLVCAEWYNNSCNKTFWRNATFTWTPESDLSEGSLTLDSLIQRGIRYLTIKIPWNKGSYSFRPSSLDGVMRFLPQVESLRLDVSHIADDFFCQPSFLSAMPRLTKLTFVDCHNIAKKTVKAIATNLTNLESLEFRKGRYLPVVMNDNSLLHIARNLGKLTRLALDNCYHVTDSGIAHLTHHGGDTNYKLARLQYLSLGRCGRLTDTSMSYLSVGQPHLKYLCIASTKVTNIGVARLSNLKHLCELVYLPRSTIIADKDVDYLATLRQLSVLRFRCQKWSLMLEFGQLAKMNNLRVLELHNFEFITNNVWSNFAKMPNLSELSLYDIIISDGNFKALADAGSRLVKLEIMGADNFITDDHLEHIARLSHLRELSLINCSHIQGTGLAHLAKGVSKITSFKMSNTHNAIAYAALVHVAGFNHLRTLTWFSDCLTSDDEHVVSFKQNRPDVNFQLKKLEYPKTGLEQELPHLCHVLDEIQSITNFQWL